MKKIALLVSIAILCEFALTHRVHSQFTREQLKSFVEEAAAYVTAHGKEAAIKEFMNKKGQFKRNELYIFAYDFNGILMAHGSDPNLVGNNFYGLEDPTGKLIIQEMIKTVKREGAGWVEYKWFHPQSRKYMTKLSYVKKMDSDWFIGAGVYYREK